MLLMPLESMVVVLGRALADCGLESICVDMPGEPNWFSCGAAWSEAWVKLGEKGKGWGVLIEFIHVMLLNIPR